MNTICFAAGMSGGHILPCISLAQRAHAQNHAVRILFFSGASTRDTRMVKSSSIITQHIPLQLIGYRRWYHAPLIAGALVIATMRSAYHLWREKPSSVISTGGIIAVPVCIAAWILRIPIELYELNVVPGSAVRILAPLATTVHLCFKQTRIDRVDQKRVCLAPYPIRFGIDALTQSIDAKKHIPSLSTDRITLFIHGGSHGSQFINGVVKALVHDFPELCPTIQIIHQTGHDETTRALRAWYGEHMIPAHVFSYDEHVIPYYRAADLIICRAGAGSLFEALFFQKPCITIPLETNSNTHQVENAIAMEYEYSELFTVVRQRDADYTARIAKQITAAAPKSRSLQDHLQM